MRYWYWSRRHESSKWRYLLLLHPIEWRPVRSYFVIVVVAVSFVVASIVVEIVDIFPVDRVIIVSDCPSATHFANTIGRSVPSDKISYCTRKSMMMRMRMTLVDDDDRIVVVVVIMWLLLMMMLLMMEVSIGRY